MGKTASAEHISYLEDRTLVKWAAWGALLISLVTAFLLGLYARRDFSPVFEYQDLELTQK
ncbi:hypothetical protein CSA56_15655 [candidate division KSB3 bacterium]|uniref:Uncharacterized protein n=1 Tax=candidate division KSB3 bacterium TaxID=2044937 RepID=A0A2G6KBU3_9BACT|nr:MAG: hypothetical protein CSA56_15655 [candidate division KSB3 bacterium]